MAETPRAVAADDITAAPESSSLRLAAGWQHLVRRVDGVIAGDAVTLSSLVLLLLYSSTAWYARIPTSVLVVAGLLFPALRRRPGYWYIIAGVTVASTALDWFILDNHKYLLAYWCIAIACTRGARDREATLADAARMLIAAAFVCAVIWKLRSADFANGTFFQYALLFDPRFEAFARLGGGATDLLLETAATARQVLVATHSTADEARLVIPAGLPWLAGMMTLWALAIELAVAVAFVAGRGTRPGRARNLLLIVFVATTYLMAPVIGFGWVLAVMGLAQCTREERNARAAYAVLFVALLVYRLPWKALVTTLLS